MTESDGSPVFYGRLVRPLASQYGRGDNSFHTSGKDQRSALGSDARTISDD